MNIFYYCFCIISIIIIFLLYFYYILLYSVPIHFQFESTLKSSLRSHDELFHITLYQWMMAKDLTERLLEVFKFNVFPNLSIIDKCIIPIPFTPYCTLLIFIHSITYLLFAQSLCSLSIRIIFLSSETWKFFFCRFYR